MTLFDNQRIFIQELVFSKYDVRHSDAFNFARLTNAQIFLFNVLLGLDFVRQEIDDIGCILS